jgi:hypothetical protein
MTSNNAIYFGGDNVTLNSHNQIPGWQYICGFTEIRHPNATELDFAINVHATSGGTIYFKDIKLYKVAIEPLKTILLTPSYKGLIYGDGGVNDINMEAFVDGGGLYDMTDFSFTSRITDADYKTILSTSTNDVKQKMNVSFSSKDLPNPPANKTFEVYYLHTILADTQTGKKYEDWWTLRKAHANWRPDVFVDEHGRIMRKNRTTGIHEPYFMRNLTIIHANNAHLAEGYVNEGMMINGIGSSGNRVDTHNSPGNGSQAWQQTWWPDRFNALANADVHMYYMWGNTFSQAATSHASIYPNWFDTSNRVQNIMGPLEGRKQEHIRGMLEAFVDYYRDNPAFGGYTLQDEIYTKRWGQEIAWNNEILANYDINRPTLGCVTWQSENFKYGDYVKVHDFAGKTAYSFNLDSHGGRDLPRTTRTVKELKEKHPNRPVYVYLQGFGPRTVAPNAVVPTTKELLNSAWQAIIEGAQGIHWYEYGPLSTEYNLVNPMEWRQKAIDVFAELTKWEPVFMSVEPAPEIKFTSSQPEWLNVTIRQLNGKAYMFAVNNTYQSQTIQINVGDETKNLNFDPTEVKIIEIPAKTSNGGAELH